MAGHTNRQDDPDRPRVSLVHDYEVKGWARKFGVTPRELAAAVAAVGHDAQDVEDWLIEHPSGH